MAEAKLCAVEDCDKPAYVRGWCTTHYQRWKKYGDPRLGGWPRKMVCEATGCDKPVLARGLCSKHYAEADFRPDCLIDGCHRKARSKGLCSAHRRRERRNGSPHVVIRPNNGECREWLEKHVRHTKEDCLIWPYSRGSNGYGPSRLMCEMAHGEPPTLDHQAAHSCGSGHLGCVNPSHLRWATRQENAAEMVEHGRSQRGEVNFNAMLAEDEVRSIRKLIGETSMRRIAQRYGVSPSTIADIAHGRTWAWLG